MLDKNEYLINIKNIDIDTAKEFSDILFDNYMLNSELCGKDKLLVFAHDDREIKKLSSALSKFGADDDYIDEVINNKKIKESKNIRYYNMKHSIKERREILQRLHESKKETSRNARLNEAAAIREMIFNNPYDPIFEAKVEKNETEKDTCKCRYNGKMISKMTKEEKVASRKELREEMRELKATIKELQKEGKATKMLEKKLERMQKILDCLMGRCETTNESKSVNNRFDRMRKMFEAEEVVTEKKDEDDEKSEEPVEEPVEDVNEEPAEEDETKEEEEYENVDLDAVVLSINKKDVDTVKADMIEAGVAEDDIDVDEPEDAEDETPVDVKISINSIGALKTYLESVGIDLAEELGGELIFDEDETKETEETEEPADEKDETPADDSFDDSELEDLF